MSTTTSPFANIFLKVKARLEEKAPSLRFIDQDLGQLDHFEVRPAVALPCALIDIDEVAFDEAGELTQTGEGIVRVRIGYPCYSSSSNLAPEEVALTALDFYEIEQEVYLALHGYGEGNFKKLIRKSARTEKRNDEYRVRETKFAIGMQDDSAVPKRITIPRPDPVIEAS